MTGGLSSARFKLASVRADSESRDGDADRRGPKLSQRDPLLPKRLSMRLAETLPRLRILYLIGLGASARADFY